MMMNLPNRLTMLRIILIPAIIIVLFCGAFEDSTARIIATAIFIVASITDFFDGYIARKRNLVTNFGKLMDPLADKLLVSAALVSLVELGNLSAWIVVVIISREFMVSGLRQLAASNDIVLAAGQLGKFKTATQMFMIIFLLLQINNDMFAITTTVLVWAAVALTVISGVEYLYKNRKSFLS